MFELASLFYLKSKRLFDICLSSISIIILSPMLVTITILVKTTSKGKIVYSQKRIGQNGKEFYMYKFRTMQEDADTMLDQLKDLNERVGNGFKIKNDPRITPIGKILRKYSLDELPQLFNILKGDMSIVGPRPALPEEVEKYDKEDMKRLNAPQGLTCFWQIYERDNPLFKVQVMLDIEYIEKRNLLLDLKLICLTIPAILKGKNAY